MGRGAIGRYHSSAKIEVLNKEKKKTRSREEKAGKIAEGAENHHILWVRRERIVDFSTRI